MIDFGGYGDDANKGFMGGQHPYWGGKGPWGGQGVIPQYEKADLPSLTKELLDSKQIDETIVYAAKGKRFFFLDLKENEIIFF